MGFLGFFWVGFLFPSLVPGPTLRGLREGVRGSGAADTRAGAAWRHPHLSHGHGGGGPLLRPAQGMRQCPDLLLITYGTYIKRHVCNQNRCFFLVSCCLFKKK